MSIHTFAFDFDGVIAEYDGNFAGHEVAGLPIKEVVDAIKILKEKGHRILIHSTRSSDFLKKYCKKHDIPADYFNENPNYDTGNKGKPVAFAYIDDRAFCYKGQSAMELVENLENFKPYYKK
jgi:hydroxymethylpyrimidine pyrophosphatase-like HAD family hydrolase